MVIDIAYYLRKLLYNTKAAVSFIRIKHLNNILMSEAFQNFNLLTKILNIFLGLSTFINKFCCTNLSSIFPPSHIYLSIKKILQGKFYE